MSYVGFDELIKRFDQKIYATRKGRLRMRLIDSLYRNYIPEDFLAGSNVLDAGGGLGQMSQWFLAQDSNVDYFDISSQMVEQVNQGLVEYVEDQKLTVSVDSILKYQPPHLYDFVNVHAVLEWLESPMAAIDSILSWVNPGGYVGLMVYNKHMLMMRHLMRGTMNKAMTGNLSGDRKGLTPISPIDPAIVYKHLIENKFDVLSLAGIRTFSDLSEQTVIDWYDEDEVFKTERALCEERPYCDLGRYILFIARKRD